MIIGSSQSNRFAQRLGRTVLIIGTAVVVLSLAAVWIILSNVSSADITNWDLLAPLFFAGIGSGLFIAPNAQFIVATVDASEAGAAAGVIQTMQRVGSAIGIAVIGSVLFGVANLSSIHGDATKHFASRISQKAHELMQTQHISLGQAKGEAYGSFASQLSAYGKHLLATHFMDAAAAAIGMSVLFSIAAFALVFVLPRRLQQWGGAPGGH
jgi:uncharacterized membrane protein